LNDAVIVDVVRLAAGKGKPGGGLAGCHTVELLRQVLIEIIARNDIDPAQLDDISAGSVEQVGEQSLNIARSAVLAAPIPATQQVLRRGGLTMEDVDAYEVNEAFACVPLAWARELGADPAKLNPRGGAIALGHALGSSGTRLLATLVNHLEATGGRYGLQTMCEGGGMANATIIERL
jgi:acetyl-CoA acetyltransferase